MVEEANDDGGDPIPDIKKQNEVPNDDEAHKAEKLSGLSSDELDEVEE